MPATTPHRRYPYPVGSDADDIPKILQDALTPVDTDMQAVRTDLDANVAALAAALSGRKIDTGGANITGGPSWSYTRAVTFNSTFASPPFVFVSIVTAAGGTDQVQVRASATTTTGFTAWIFNLNRTNLQNGGVNLSVPIRWLAIGS
jgi:hypothetical protein